MRRTNARVLMIVAPLALALGAPAALAGPFDPPYAGAPNSVHLAFDWNAHNTPWNVDEFFVGSTTYPLDSHDPSSIESGTDVAFICPNLIDDLPIKYVRIQLSFDGPIPLDLLNVSVVGHDPAGATAIETGRGGPTGDGFTYYIDFEIRPNPDWEEIFFFGNESANIVPGNFLRIEIDTITIPAPAGVAPFAALGALAFRRRR